MTAVYYFTLKFTTHIKETYCVLADKIISIKDMKDTARCLPSHLCEYVTSKFYVFEYRCDDIFLFFFVYTLVLSILSRMYALTVMQHVLNVLLIYYETRVKKCSFRTLGGALQKALAPMFNWMYGVGRALYWKVRLHCASRAWSCSKESSLSKNFFPSLSFFFQVHGCESPLSSLH